MDKYYKSRFSADEVLCFICYKGLMVSPENIFSMMTPTLLVSDFLSPDLMRRTGSCSKIYPKYLKMCEELKKQTPASRSFNCTVKLYHTKHFL